MGAGSRCRRCATGALLIAWIGAVPAATAVAQTDRPLGEWRAFGADAANTKYSPLDQITADNFTDLEIAWRWRSLSADVAATNEAVNPGPFKTAPLMVGGLVYASTALGQVAALDAGTGELVWSYDPRTYDRLDRPANMGWQHRGVSYWEDDRGDDARIFIATHDLLLVAMNARTGALYPDFGADGTVDLSTSLGRAIDRSRLTHSQPLAIAGDTVIVGSIVQDTSLQYREADPGHVRGFDARTGEMKWIFHTIPQGDEFGADSWHNESWRYSGHTNVWGTMAVDEDLGYVYLPTGTPTNDWYGGMTATPPHRLRVGYDISKVFGVSDGIARYSELLLRGLLACGDDIQFTLCNLGGDALEHARVEQLFGADRARIVLAPDGSPRGLDVDLFHSPALAVPPAECRPLVFTLHDVTFISHAECHTLDNRVWSLATTAMAAARATRIVADSHYSKAQAIEHLGLPDELIEVIHLAPDPCFQRTEDSDLQHAVARRLGITRPYVLAVGTIEPRKNLVGLIDGMRRLPAAQRERLSLVVAGPEGWRNDEIHERLREARDELSICPVGCVSRDDLNVLYSFAEAFVYPSLSEGFGFPVLEAMACGAPVVTSDCSSLPEIAGDAAILVNPTDTAAIADAIARVVCDEATRLDLRSRGLARAREFSWERTAAQFLDLYRRVVKG